MVVPETKLDDSFPTRQFLIKDFTEPCSLYKNGLVGEVLVYFREDILSKLLVIDILIEKINL